MREQITAFHNKERFSAAVEAAMTREKGIHGSVGTQNEKIIHAALKNYYAPYSDEQEIKIGNFFADAVCEDGIFEIQTHALYRLKEKLKVFLEYSTVTIVHPVISEYRMVYINSQSGEVVKETPTRRMKTLLSVFKELYSVRDFLCDDDLKVMICGLKAEKRIYFSGEELPDMKKRSARKKCSIEMVPIELLSETSLERPADYEIFLPREALAEYPDGFTKKQLSKAAKESASSLRTEVLRTVGVIEKTGKKGNEFIYRISERNNI